jgi:phosphoribosylaminoimidazole-succinocarboxamide synthase
MLFPKGKVAKLCRTRTPNLKKFKLKDILVKFDKVKPQPVIVLSGARFHDKGKFLAGIARAAFKTGACIIDSGVRTGIEPFCMRNSKIV